MPSFSDTMHFGHCIFYVRCWQCLETGKVSLHFSITKSKRRKIIWCICIFSCSFLVAQNSVKQIILWSISQFCRSLVHSLLSWIFIWFSECVLERNCRKHSENHKKFSLVVRVPRKITEKYLLEVFVTIGFSQLLHETAHWTLIMCVFQIFEGAN